MNTATSGVPPPPPQNASPEFSYLNCGTGQFFWGGVCLPGQPKCLIHTGVQCVECRPGFYLQRRPFRFDNFGLQFFLNQALGVSFADEFECLPFSDPNCQLFVKHKCVKCNDKYSLDETNNKCVEIVPTAPITDCESYSDKDNCALCVDGKALLTNTCTDAPPEIENCAELSNPSNCKTCASTHKLDKGACVQVTTVTAECLVHGPDEVCVECKPTFFLDSQKKCTAIPAPVDKCEIYSDKACVQCAPGFFLDTVAVPPVCSAVDPPLPACVYYETKTKCKYC